MNKNGMLCAILVMGTLAAVSCSRRQTQTAGPAGGEPAHRPVVYTVNYPLQYFALRIGGDRVDVVFPAPPDEDPAYWNPDGDMVAAYQQADLILLNGAGYAKWAAMVSLPAARVVDTSAGQEEALIELEENISHTHGPGGEHAHAGVAFTTWLDGTLALAQATAVRDAMVRTWPDLGEDFEAGFEGLRHDLAALDEALAAAVPRNSEVRVVFSHPVYQYLARRYGIQGRSVHFEPGEEPSPAQWAALESMLAESPATVMIWEGEPLPAVADRLETLGLSNIVFSPAGNVPDHGDYFSVMQANAERLAAALAPGGIARRPIE